MLHGQIAVNDNVIGGWSAQVVEGASKDNARTYQCEVAWVSRTGEQITKTFQVTHRESDGPIALASRVLAHADTVSRWRRP